MTDAANTKPENHEENIIPIELLTPEEVADLLRVKTRQLRERIMKRPGFPKPLNQRVMGSLIRWKKEDIMKWVENNGRQ